MPIPAPKIKGKRSSMGSIPWHSERPRPSKHQKGGTSHKLDRPDKPGKHGRPGKQYRLRPNKQNPKPTSYSHSSRPSSKPPSRPPKTPYLTRPHPDRPSRPISEGPTVSTSRPTTSSSHSKPSKHRPTSKPQYPKNKLNTHASGPQPHYHSYSTNPTSSRPPHKRPSNSSIHSHHPSPKPSYHELSSTQASNAPSTTSYLPTSTTSSRPKGYPKPLPRGHGFPIIAHGNFLSNRPLSFTFEPVPKPSSYTIRTRGTNRFRIVHKMASLHATKTIIDNYTGVPVPLLRMYHHMFSARGAVTISAVGGGPLMVLQRSSVVRVGKRVLHGYVRGRSGKPDLVIQAGDGSREFIMRDRRSNEVARVYRNRVSRRGDRPKRYAYKVVVHPGYDTLLFVMCVVCMQEMLDDTQ